MNTIQLIKKHLPQVHNKDRKRFEVVLEVKAKQNKTTVLEEINVLKEQYANQKKKILSYCFIKYLLLVCLLKQMIV